MVKKTLVVSLLIMLALCYLSCNNSTNENSKPEEYRELDTTVFYDGIYHISTVIPEGYRVRDGLSCAFDSDGYIIAQTEYKNGIGKNGWVFTWFKMHKSRSSEYLRDDQGIACAKVFDTLGNVTTEEGPCLPEYYKDPSYADSQRCVPWSKKP